MLLSFVVVISKIRILKGKELINIPYTTKCTKQTFQLANRTLVSQVIAWSIYEKSAESIPVTTPALQIISFEFFTMANNFIVLYLHLFKCCHEHSSDIALFWSLYPHLYGPTKSLPNNSYLLYIQVDGKFAFSIK